MAGRPLHLLHDLVQHLRRAATPADHLGPSDAELLGRFTAAGDEAAFELLVWRHAGMVLGVCRRAVRDEQDAEDAFQATFLVLARKAGSVRGESVAGWLYRVARRLASRVTRCEARRRARQHPLSDLEPPSPQPEPCAEAATSELRRAMDEEVARLPRQYREALVLCCLACKSCADAARELGCAIGTVESRLARARQRLRAALARRGFEASAIAPLSVSAGPGGVVQPAMVASTARAAVLFAAGQVGPVYAPAIVLAEGALRGTVMGKLKVLGALALAVALLGSVAAWFGQGEPQRRHAIRC